MSRRGWFALLAVLAGGFGLSTQAQAFEVKHSAAGELVRWRRANVAWTVDRSLREVKGGDAAVMAAVAAWTGREGAPSLAAESSDTVLEPGFDHKNTVFFARDGYEPAGIALAVTVLSFDERTGDVLDADIVLNGKYHFAPVVVDNVRTAAQAAADRAAAAPPTYDIGRVLAHEMGHALGLSDEPASKDALMYPYVPHSRALGAAPGADDVAGLQALYGGAADANASGAGRDARESDNTRGCSVAPAAPVVTPPSYVVAPSSAYDARAVVTRVHTTSVHGVFRTDVELATTACASVACPDVSRAVVWGGTIDGIRQIVGGVQVPEAGEKIGLVLEPSPEPPQSRSLDGVVRTMTRIAE